MKKPTNRDTLLDVFQTIAPVFNSPVFLDMGGTSNKALCACGLVGDQELARGIT